MHEVRRRLGPLVVCLFVAACGATVSSSLPGGSPRVEPGRTGPAPSVPASPAAIGVTPSAPAVAPEVDTFGLIDTRHGWATEGDRLYVTADGGATWQKSTFGHGFPPVFTDPELGWQQDPFTGTGGTLRRTEDAGQTWHAVGLPAHVGSPGVPRFVDADHAYLMTAGTTVTSDRGPGGTLLATSDRGRTWSRVADLPAGVSGDLVVLNARDLLAMGSTRIVGGNGDLAWDLIFASHDGGNSWESTSPPPGALELTSAGPGAAILLDLHGNGPTEVSTTSDGRRWSDVGSVAGFLTGLAPVDTSEWYAELRTADGALGFVDRTTDAGRTWTDVPAAGIPDDATIRLAQFVDSATGWALVDPPGGFSGAASVGQLYATVDGGRTWKLLMPGVGDIPTPGPCRVETAVLGAMPALTPEATTPWFNVILFNLDSTAPATLSFDVPVVAWPTSDLAEGPPGTFSIARGVAPTVKFTFRPAAVGVTHLVVRLDGRGCAASAVVVLPTGE